MPECPKCNQEVGDYENFCPNCGYSMRGTGKKGSVIIECSRCSGSGEIRKWGGLQSLVCPVCEGSGKVRI